MLLCLMFVSACNNDDPTPQNSKELTTQKLNDTGITWRGLMPKGNDETCAPTELSAQQDCDIGQDASINKNSNTASSFNYIKIDTQGSPLPYDAKQWSCVEDQVSGLLWEVKTNIEGLHNANNKFTWYNSDKKLNGGKIGDWNNLGDHCYGYEAGKPKTYCHTEQLVSRVNKKGLCGFNDWRLPNRTELTSLINFGRIEPTINTQFFPYTQDDFYWTNSPTATRTLEAWTISFEYGFTAPMRRTDTRYARLVRSNKSEQSNSNNEVNSAL